MNNIMCFFKNIISLGNNSGTYIGLISLKTAQESIKPVSKRQPKRKDIKISDLMRRSSQH